MQDVMIDLETMGNSANAAIVSIGAVFFDPETKQLGKKFYERVSLRSSHEIGLSIEPDTTLWWMEQPDAARIELTLPGMHIEDALIDFSELFLGEKTTGKNTQNIRIWGNGAAFDNVILSNAYKKAKIKQPWEFWNDRCYRTMKAMNRDVPFVRTGVAHNALDDAISQANHLMAILDKLETKA